MNGTALPSVVAADRQRAYDFARIASYDELALRDRLTDRQRVAVVDSAAVALSVGAPETASEMLAATGMTRRMVQALLRVLGGVTPDQWTVTRTDRAGDVTIDHGQLTIDVPLAASYNGTLAYVTGLIEDLSWNDARAILGPEKQWPWLSLEWSGDVLVPLLKNGRYL